MSIEKMACASKVLQSKSEVRLDEGFNIEIRRPVRSGKRNRRVMIPSIDRLRKTSIRCVPDDDLNICFTKAILRAIVEVEKDANRVFEKKRLVPPSKTCISIARENWCITRTLWI
ncbi:uncharacterized protein TNCT_289821 [Trichonephila clavata]|uniref:Uncharacterized protein n=1 Tax=Trichonephila clavata TaxID=2740835 RepID=A0A8X6HIV4_TRICU|nr:uncharacterized protein TNCT_289821 [Trichonephila clavata]